MRILIDADACPVVDIAISLAKEFSLECIIICDTAHVFEKEGAQTVRVSKGSDSVDFALVNMLKVGDIAITQDYGLAAMCLARQAQVLDQNGRRYSDKNIDDLLLSRHTAVKVRRAGGRIKGPPKRRPEQDKYFEQALHKLITQGLDI